ncbi:MAG: hypothetical protein JWO67_4046 [Streptosporangiaceae bacterium]|nr:hypothetical protein [Streptosporangiaceae bacterium]
MASQLIEVELRWRHLKITTFTSQADPDNPDDLQALLLDAIKRDPAAQRRDVPEYKIRIYDRKTRRKLISYVGRSEPGAR